MIKKESIFQIGIDPLTVYGNPDMYQVILKYRARKRKSLRDPWISLGEFYGYPPCCIQHMVRSEGFRGMSTEFKTEYLKSPFDGFGFIPCPKHLTYDVSDMIDLINANRNEFYPKVSISYCYGVPVIYTKDM